MLKQKNLKLCLSSMVSFAICDFFWIRIIFVFEYQEKKTFLSFGRHRVYNVFRNIMLCLNVSG